MNISDNILDTINLPPRKYYIIVSRFNNQVCDINAIKMQSWLLARILKIISTSLAKTKKKGRWGKTVRP